MKSWADHCSSDEESDDVPRVSSLGNLQGLDDNDSDSDHSDEVSEEEEVPTYNFPTDPPFTAFVGNIPFDIQDANHLAYELQELCKKTLNKEVTAVNGRLMLDRDTGKKKGFGYVEFETLDDVRFLFFMVLHVLHCWMFFSNFYILTLYLLTKMFIFVHFDCKTSLMTIQLKIIMELNNKAELSGRKIRLDVANPPKNQRPNSLHRNRQGRSNHNYPPNQGTNINHHRPNNVPEIDGSQFQKGRFQRSTSHTAATSESSSNHSKLRRNHSTGATDLSSSSDVPKSRPTLKLAPRSKSLASGSSNPSTSQSSIFGGAKPREDSNKNGNVDTHKNGSLPTPTAILKPVRKQSSSTSISSNTDVAPLVDSNTTNNSNSNASKNNSSLSMSNKNHSSSFRRGKDTKDRNHRRVSGRSGRGKKQQDRRGSNPSNNKRGGTNDSIRKGSDGWDETQSKPNKTTMEKKNNVVEVRVKLNFMLLMFTYYLFIL